MNDADEAQRVAAFVESDCKWGGCACGAWADWFQASEDADPRCMQRDEDGDYLRDPVPLTDFPMVIADCARPDTCANALRARRILTEQPADDTGERA